MTIDFSLLLNSLPLMLQGAAETVQIAIVSILLGLTLGALTGIFNSRKLRHPILGMLLNGYIWILRGTPLFVQVLIAYYALPEVIGCALTPFAAGVLALGINSSAYISEIVRGGIDAIAPGQWDAAYVLGLTRRQTLCGIILPQMFRITIPNFTNELASLIKETSILMVIGVAELTKMSKDIVARELDPITIYLATACIYLLMTSTISGIAKMIEKRYHS